MDSTELRNKLHKLIDEASETSLKTFLELIQDIEQDVSSEEFELTEAHKEILEERKRLHESGETSSFTWAKALEKIRAQRKNAI